MKSAQLSVVKVSAKAPTGISGFDAITVGGLPRGRTTLLAGGPGSGKTVFALQFLAHGAQECKEPGVFVAFEETSNRILSNAAGFGWKLAELVRKNLFILDAQPLADLVLSGDFDLGAMLAVLEAKIKHIGARRIVFDAIDVILALLPDPSAQRREVYRLHQWLLAHELTGIITLKSRGDETSSISQQPFNFMQFMVDCSIVLNHTVAGNVSKRSLRVQKFRGSSFDENESPFTIADDGVRVASVHTPRPSHIKLSKERVSTGIERLDTMLGGGYFRGASVLITGYSGTAKTTLSGLFAQAACRRGERALFVCFDTVDAEVVRNLSSVGIRLDRYLKNGLLKLTSARSITGSAETYLVRLKMMVEKHDARFVIIDPVSAWSKSGHELTMQLIMDRLIDWTKSMGITLLCTSLFDEMSDQSIGVSPLQISTMVDTWINLTYLVQNGERNRGLTIVKSRGMAHSNQLRELVLSDTGVTLTDTYSAGGDVMMGTLRWEKEHAAQLEQEASELNVERMRARLESEESELQLRLRMLQDALIAKQVEKALLIGSTEKIKKDSLRSRAKLKGLRGNDTAMPKRKVSRP